MSQTEAAGFMDAAHKARQFGSYREKILPVIDSVMSSLEAGNIASALSILKIIKPALDFALSYSDKYKQLLIDDKIEFKLRNRRIYELQLEVARLKHDEELAEACEHFLREIDEFFSEAISDLDPDHVK
jgi:hypothetical protein